MCACVRVCERACVRACVCVCVCESARARAGRACVRACVMQCKECTRYVCSTPFFSLHCASPTAICDAGNATMNWFC